MLPYALIRSNISKKFFMQGSFQVHGLSLPVLCYITVPTHRHYGASVFCHISVPTHRINAYMTSLIFEVFVYQSDKLVGILSTDPSVSKESAHKRRERTAEVPLNQTVDLGILDIPAFNKE